MRPSLASRILTATGPCRTSCSFSQSTLCVSLSPPLGQLRSFRRIPGLRGESHPSGPRTDGSDRGWKIGECGLTSTVRFVCQVSDLPEQVEEVRLLIASQPAVGVLGRLSAHEVVSLLEGTFYTPRSAKSLRGKRTPCGSC
jgi:hypothetical protein